MKSLYLATKTHKHATGFTLVELMVSLSIGLVLMAGILQLYITSSKVTEEIARTNTAIENGRLVIQVFNNDIVHGGFWDGYIPEYDDYTSSNVPSDVPTAVPDPCLSYASWNAAYVTNILGIPVQVYDAVPSSCTSLLQDRQAGTDVLLVRHADTSSCQPDAGTCDANFLHFQASMCDSFSNYTYSLLNDTSLLLNTQRDCSSINQARKYVSNIYYVRNYSIVAGDGIPTLMRSTFGVVSGMPTQLPPVALIEGIESFKVELGIDSVSDAGAAVNYGGAVTWADTSNKTSPTNRGDGIADGAFVRCTTATPCTANQLLNTVAVKVHVLVRNLTPSNGYTDTKTYTFAGGSVGPFNDSYLRHVYSSTIRLNNISSRRETP